MSIKFDAHFSLCYEFDQQHLANCLEFNHDMTFDCAGQSECENSAPCFEDIPDCPNRSICVCRPCFYGGRCQFSTSGVGLSLDAILGYHIQPHLSIIYQPAIFIFTLARLIVPISEVSSSDTSADFLSVHTCRDRYTVVSVFAVTFSIILISYVSSLLPSVCTVLPSSLYKLVSDVTRTEME